MAPRTIYANLADGLQPFNLWDVSLSDMGLLGALPCTATGTNALTLTQTVASFAPTVSAYQNYLLFSFVAVATSTGAVTLRIGTLASLPVYRADGVTQAGASDLLINAFYVVAYNSALNAGSGGFQAVSGNVGGGSAGGSGPVRQVTTSSDVIPALTPAVAIVRAAPVTTALTLPTVASQAGVPMHIFDWSTSVTGHTITITPNGAETIMRAANWQIFSNSASLGSATFYPSTALSGWYIA
jgi:hypothetical protein